MRCDRSHSDFVRPGADASSELAFASPEGHDREKLRAKIIEKYRQCMPGALNVVVIQPAHDVLDNAAQGLALEFLGSERPHLTAVVVLSSWPGNSQVLPNPGASPAAPPGLIEVLTELAELDDDMWTAGDGSLASAGTMRR